MIDARNPPYDPTQKVFVETLDDPVCRPLSPIVDHLKTALGDYSIASDHFLCGLAVAIYLINHSGDHCEVDYIDERLSAIVSVERALHEYDRLLYVESEDEIDSDRRHVIERLRFHLGLDKNALALMYPRRTKGFSTATERIIQLLQSLIGNSSILIDGKPLTAEQAQDALRKIHIHKGKNLLLNVGWSAVKKRISEWRHRFDVPLVDRSAKIPVRRIRPKKDISTSPAACTPQAPQNDLETTSSSSGKTRSPRKPLLGKPPKTIPSKRR